MLQFVAFIIHLGPFRENHSYIHSRLLRGRNVWIQIEFDWFSTNVKRITPEARFVGVTWSSKWLTCVYFTCLYWWYLRRWRRMCPFISCGAKRTQFMTFWPALKPRSNKALWVWKDRVLFYILYIPILASMDWSLLIAVSLRYQL